VQISPGDPEHLTLSYHLCRLDSLDCRPRRSCRTWALHRAEPSFDMAVIGFDPVITVTARPLTTSPSHMALVLKLVNRRRIAPQTVSGEYAWRLVVRVGQRVLQEHFGCGSVSCSER
jgi:hypothetical protein